MNVKEMQDRLTELVEKGFAKPDTEINIGVGNDLHPVKTIYRDDAPFGNLNCVFVAANPEVSIHRPSLL